MHLQTDRDVEVIHVERDNTVKSLTDKLQELVNAGHSDSGFPILRSDEGGSRMVGYIGANELEHALSQCFLSASTLHATDATRASAGIVADDPDEKISFHPTDPHAAGHGAAQLSASVSSLVETGSVVLGQDPCDFSCYMDQAPLTVQDNSPLELVQQFFTKLGARYVVVTDTDGYCEWLWFAFGVC